MSEKNIPVKKPLVRASQENAFELKDGRKLYDLEDLFEALKTMDEKIFRHHVNQDQNDFIDWIKEVLGDKKLGRKLRWTTTRETTLEKIKEHMDEHYIT